MNNINNTLKDNIHTASILKTNFYNYFYKVFNCYPDDSFIGVTSKLIPYFEELKKYILTNEYSISINILKNYSIYEQSLKEDDIEDLLELLQDIYTELFVDSVYSIPCTASEYFINDNMQHREKNKINEIYETNNFILPEENKLPVDHISIEMLYMQQLNALLTKYLEEDNTDKIINILQSQYNFIQAHLLTWINEFAVHLKEQISQKENNLYFASAGIISEFLKYDKSLTEEFLKLIKK